MRRLDLESGRWSTRVGDENIDATKPLYTCIDESLDVISVGNVRGHGQDTCVTTLRNRGCGLIESVRVARAKHERRALSREFFSNRATKPLAAGSHESNFIFESEIHDDYFRLR